MLFGFTQMLFNFARIAGISAAIAIVGGTGFRAAHQPAVTPSDVVVVDSAIDIPTDWSSYPVVAHVHSEDLKRTLYKDFFFSGTDTVVGSLGDIRIRYDETFCTAGGSACSQSPRTLTNLRVGDEDLDAGLPIFTSVDCTTTRSYEEISHPRRSCSPESFTLRRSLDGNKFVVTFVDPDPTEKPVAAFMRSVVAKSKAPLSRCSISLCALVVGFFIAGVLVLWQARSFFGERGVLTWRSARMRERVITCGEFSAILREPASGRAVVLVDPSVIERTVSYRDAPFIATSAIYFGSHAIAKSRAQTAAVCAGILFLAALGTAATCAALVLF